ncbi:hypothetical protein OQA88_4508 [Cercophora sp. LCS_1]
MAQNNRRRSRRLSKRNVSSNTGKGDDEPQSTRFPEFRLLEEASVTRHGVPVPMTQGPGQLATNVTTRRDAISMVPEATPTLSIGGAAPPTPPPYDQSTWTDEPGAAPALPTGIAARPISPYHRYSWTDQPLAQNVAMNTRPGHEQFAHAGVGFAQDVTTTNTFRGPNPIFGAGPVQGSTLARSSYRDASTQTYLMWAPPFEYTPALFDSGVLTPAPCSPTLVHATSSPLLFDLVPQMVPQPQPQDTIDPVYLVHLHPITTTTTTTAVTADDPDGDWEPVDEEEEQVHATTNPNPKPKAYFCRAGARSGRRCNLPISPEDMIAHNKLEHEKSTVFSCDYCKVLHRKVQTNLQARG